jgi:cytochrome c oxidase subunit 1
MHMLGLEGMPRRIYTYAAEMGWEPNNLLATIGAVIIFIGGVVFIANAMRSRGNGEPAGPNPWDADSLEWATASPPENYNFVNLPGASSRYPLWTDPKERIATTGIRNDRREVLVTTLMDAEPHHRYVLPGDTIWPLLTALAVTVGFVGSVFRPIWITPGSILTAIALVGWFWPRPPLELES